MARVEIYTKMFCGYCVPPGACSPARASSIEEYDITLGGPKRAEMIQRANGRTSVPQIFIDGTHVGGSDDIHALEHAGKLDPMLAADEDRALPGADRNRPGR